MSTVDAHLIQRQSLKRSRRIGVRGECANQGVSSAERHVVLADEAAKILERYRGYLRDVIGLLPAAALSLTPDSYKDLQTYFLLLAPELLALPGVDMPDTTRELLSVSSYARFRSIVCFDALLDGTDAAPRPFHAYEAQVHLEAAVRSAASAGVSCGHPQRSLHRLARTYLKTRHVEINLAAGEFELARLLFRKSSMALLPVEWASHFGAERRMVIRARAAAIKLFIALQLFDDVMDLERDIAQAQNTLLYAQLRALCPKIDPAKLTITDKRVRDLMVAKLSIAGGKAISAARLYEEMNSTKLAGCCLSAAYAANALRAKLEAYGEQ